MPIPPGSAASAERLPSFLNSIPLTSCLAAVAKQRFPRYFAVPLAANPSTVLHCATILRTDACWNSSSASASGRKPGTPSPFANSCATLPSRSIEHRLALQLVVSQIVCENSSSDVAVMRILEALCVSQGWDMAVKWGVNTEEKRLEFGSAWAAPGHRAETFIQESMGLHLPIGTDLPGRAWQDGR